MNSDLERIEERLKRVEDKLDKIMGQSVYMTREEFLAEFDLRALSYKCANRDGGCCVFTTIDSITDDDCIYCGEPSERK